MKYTYGTGTWDRAVCFTCGRDLPGTERSAEICAECAEKEENFWAKKE
jgi:hypothetical protein